MISREFFVPTPRPFRGFGGSLCTRLLSTTHLSTLEARRGRPGLQPPGVEPGRTSLAADQTTIRLTERSIYTGEPAQESRIRTRQKRRRSGPAPPTSSTSLKKSGGPLRTGLTRDTGNAGGGGPLARFRISGEAGGRAGCRLKFLAIIFGFASPTRNQRST